MLYVYCIICFLGKAEELDKQVLSRAVPQQIVAFYVKKISGLEPELQELFKQVLTNVLNEVFSFILKINKW